MLISTQNAKRKFQNCMSGGLKLNRSVHADVVMNKPDITIVMTTYIPPSYLEERYNTMCRAMQSWFTHLKYDGDIWVHLADDGTRDLYLDLFTDPKLEHTGSGFSRRIRSM